MGALTGTKNVSKSRNEDGMVSDNGLYLPSIPNPVTVHCINALSVNWGNLCIPDLSLPPFHSSSAPMTVHNIEGILAPVRWLLHVQKYHYVEKWVWAP